MNRTEHDVDVLGAGVNSAIAIWDDYMQPQPTGRNAGNIAVVGNLISRGGFSVYAEDRSAIVAAQKTCPTLPSAVTA
jgi:hypothetical protein